MKIEHDGLIYAELVQFDYYKNLPVTGTSWFGKETEPLQGSVMKYDKDKVFRTHRHKLNPRIINYTQEAFIVITGKLKVEIFESVIEPVQKLSDDGLFFYKTNQETTGKLGQLIAESGDIIFVWRGFHKISILEDKTVAYEIKAGSFTSVQQDKEFSDL